MTATPAAQLEPAADDETPALTTPKGGRSVPGLVVRLALADLRHELTLSLCMMLAIAAVIGPLLLLFGLKYGTIDTLRGRLIRDPKNREVLPTATRKYPDAFFEQMRGDARVAFAIPTTRSIAARLEGLPTDGDEDADTVRLEVWPTGEGDPLLLANGAERSPGLGECVLSYEAAAQLGVEAGGQVDVAATRTRRGRVQRARATLHVIAVLDVRATPLKVIATPLPFLSAIERYRDGQAVPEIEAYTWADGWTGQLPEAYPTFDGVVAVLRESLKPTDEALVRASTGLAGIDAISAEAFEQRVGVALPEGRAAYFLPTLGRAAEAHNVMSVRNNLRNLRGLGDAVLPWIDPMPATLEDGSGTREVLILAWGYVEPPRPAMWDAMPAWGFDVEDRIVAGPPPAAPPPAEADGPSTRPGTRPATAPSPRPPGFSRREPRPVTLTVRFDDRELAFPARLDGDPGPDGTLFAPPRLAGILRLLRDRDIDYRAEQEAFLLSGSGWRGFRMYAATIDDVEPLKRELESRGIAVATKADRIAEVRQMDKVLSIIFGVIAAGGIVGAIAALGASLYGSVQRKRRDLSVLRLLGLPPTRLLRFPLYQSAVIAVGGFAVACGLFYGLGGFLNHYASRWLEAGERFCHLPPRHLGLALAGTVVLAIISAAVAARQVTRVDPADALRDE